MSNSWSQNVNQKQFDQKNIIGAKELDCFTEHKGDWEQIFRWIDYEKIDHANVLVCHKTIQNVSQGGILSTMPSRNIVGKQQHRQRWYNNMRAQ